MKADRGRSAHRAQSSDAMSQRGSAPGKRTLTMELPVQLAAGARSDETVSPTPSSGSGRSLPEDVRGQMERSFGFNFASVQQSATLAGPAPDGRGRHTLNKVLPRIAASAGGTGTGQTSWADCGRISREVMGHTRADQPPHAVVNGAGGNLQETATSSSPATLRGNVLVDLGLGATPAAALVTYQAMTPTAREAFDQQHGLDRYAAPSIGEAFSTEAASGFNFHWGGVVLQSGGDRVTLENFYKGGTYDSQDTAWYFQTYGSPSHPGQTWHDQWHDPANPDSMTMRTSTRSITGQTTRPVSGCARARLTGMIRPTTCCSPTERRCRSSRPITPTGCGSKCGVACMPGGTDGSWRTSSREADILGGQALGSARALALACLLLRCGSSSPGAGPNDHASESHTMTEQPVAITAFGQLPTADGKTVTVVGPIDCTIRSRS